MEKANSPSNPKQAKRKGVIMAYDLAAPLTNGVFIYGIKLLAGTLWCVCTVLLLFGRH